MQPTCFAKVVRKTVALFSSRIAALSRHYSQVPSVAAFPAALSDSEQAQRAVSGSSLFRLLCSSSGILSSAVGRCWQDTSNKVKAINKKGWSRCPCCVPAAQCLCRPPAAMQPTDQRNQAQLAMASCLTPSGGPEASGLSVGSSCRHS